MKEMIVSHALIGLVVVAMLGGCGEDSRAPAASTASPTSAVAPRCVVEPGVCILWVDMEHGVVEARPAAEISGVPGHVLREEKIVRVERVRYGYIAYDAEGRRRWSEFTEPHPYPPRR